MIIFMGVAGSGKSIQGRLLADTLGLPWLSTGEFLRMLVAGAKRQSMVKGQLLEDSEIISLVQKIFSLVDVNQEFVLDGFPRTVVQADWLLNQVKHGQLAVTAVIHLVVGESEAAARLMKRARPDDHETAVQARFSEYEQTIKPILQQLMAANLPIHEINGEQSVTAVHQDIMAALKR